MCTPAEPKPTPGHRRGEHHARRAPRGRRRRRPRGAGSARRTRAPSPTTRRRPGWRPGRAGGRRATRAARARRRAARGTTRPRGRSTSSPVEEVTSAGSVRTSSGSTIALRRAQVAVRDPGLDLHVGDVEHGDGRRLRAGARRGRDREVRPQRRRRLAALADRRVDVVHDRRRVGRDRGRRPSRCRCSSRRRPTTKPSTSASTREVGGVLEGLERRLHAGAVVDDDLDALAPRSLARTRSGWPSGGDAGVGDQQRALHAEALELPAGVGGGAGPELDRRRLQGEDRLVLAGMRSSLSSCRPRRRRTVACHT